MSDSLMIQQIVQQTASSPTLTVNYAHTGRYGNGSISCSCTKSNWVSGYAVASVGFYGSAYNTGCGTMVSNLTPGSAPSEVWSQYVSTNAYITAITGQCTASSISLTASFSTSSGAGSMVIVVV